MSKNNKKTNNKNGEIIIYENKEDKKMSEKAKNTTTNWYKSYNEFTLPKVNDETIAKRNKKFEKLCKKTQEEMKRYCESRLVTLGYKPISEDGFILAKGTYPVLLMAHMDTVHVETPKTFYYNADRVYSSEGIGGDDRCGIYMALKIAEEINCSILFTEDEEIGCVGAEKFTKTHYDLDLDVNYIIEFDRKGKNDAVFYECANEDFEEFITTEQNGKSGYFKTNYGSCSDICYVAPFLGVAAVNLSCGYYDEHKLNHYVVLDEMYKVIDEAKKIIKREVKEKFEWIEQQYSWYDRYYYDYSSYKNNYNDKNSCKYAKDYDYLKDYYNDDDSFWEGYTNGYQQGVEETEEESEETYSKGYKKGYSDGFEDGKDFLSTGKMLYHICYEDKETGKEKVMEIQANNVYEVIGIFMFKENQENNKYSIRDLSIHNMDMKEEK